MTKIDFAITLLIRAREFGLEYGANRVPGTAIAALMVLAKHGDWMKGTDLGTATGVDPSSFSCAVNSICHIGLIERRPSQIGRFNGWDWKLTPAGERAVARFLAAPAPEADPVTA